MKALFQLTSERFKKSLTFAQINAEKRSIYQTL